MKTVAAALLLFFAFPEASAETVTASSLAVPHPGRGEAMSLLLRGTEAYGKKDLPEALRALEAAVAEDPLLVPAWVNLSAAALQACLKNEALFAAQVARLLDPAEETALHNLEEARKMSCPPSGAAGGWTESALEPGRDLGEAANWVRLGGEFRGRGLPLLAAFCEERAEALGGGSPEGRLRIATDLENAGLLRPAASLYAALPGELAAEKVRILGERLEEVGEAARILGEEVASLAGAAEAEAVAGAVQVAEVLLGKGMPQEEAAGKLRRILGVEQGPRSVEGGWGQAGLEPGWISVEPPAEPGAPWLVLRRFPGDTQILLYPWAGSGRETPEIVLLRLFASRSPVMEGPWQDCPQPEGWGACRRVTVGLDMGLEGREPIEFRLLTLPSEDRGFLLAAMAGSGGGGRTGMEQARQNIQAQIARLTLDPRAAIEPLPAAGAVFPVPAAWQSLRPHSEAEDPWRVFSLGDRLSIDLPPGLTAARVSPGFSDAATGPLTRLWFRGEFADQEKKRVVIGDAGHAGRVDVKKENPAEWQRTLQNPAALAPRTDPAARFIKAASLTPARGKAGLGGEAQAARFAGGAFQGEWLVFRCRVEGYLVDVVIPVAQGQQSLALFWIPLVVRREDQTVPPPVADLVHPYQVRFGKISDRSRGADPREGVLTGGGLTLAVPKGFKVGMSPASREGFPITLRHPDGSTLVLEKLVPRPEAGPEVRRREVQDLFGPVQESGWKAGPRFRGGVLEWAALTASGAEEARREVILLLPENHSRTPAYRLVLRWGVEVKDDLGRSRRQLLLDSFRATP